MLRIENLVKTFTRTGEAALRVVDVPQFDLAAGAQVALRGTSGTGKTTFLHLISGIHSVDAGRILIEADDMAALSESKRDALRARKIGYIFQTFNLLQGHTARDNVLLGMAFGGKADSRRADELLDRMGLADRRYHLPRQLSVGQQQRVALARALASKPRLILADEPTGNLDRAHATEAVGLLRETARETGAALLLVSHDEAVLAAFETVVDFRSLNRAAGGITP